MGHDVVNFESDVLDRSRTIPVLVDFWAPWCGPCRVLGPILERLATESEGRWSLAKVNTDENPDVSQSFGIRGIPAVKLFIDGKVVKEFTGALPEPALRRWLKEALPDDGAQNLAEAHTLLLSGDHTGAEHMLQDLLASDPDNARAQILLAGASVLTRPEEALALLPASDAEPDLVPVASSVRILVEAIRLTQDAEALPDEPERDRFVEALSAIADRDYDGAILALINVLQRNRFYANDAPRKVGVALFTLLGAEHPVTLRHRRTFDMWLY